MGYEIKRIHHFISTHRLYEFEPPPRTGCDIESFLSKVRGLECRVFLLLDWLSVPPPNVPITEERIVLFIPFPKALAQSEKQTTSFRILCQLNDFISQRG